MFKQKITDRTFSRKLFLKTMNDIEWRLGKSINGCPEPVPNKAEDDNLIDLEDLLRELKKESEASL